MTRSTKKHFFGSYYTCESDRKYKEQASRRERRKIRQLLTVGYTEDELPTTRQFGDGEDFGKGKKVHAPTLQRNGWDFSFRELLRWVRK